MMIKDLSNSKELDRKALTEVRGGGDQLINSQTAAISEVHQANLFGVQVGLNQTEANSTILASNAESTSFGGFYPWVF